MRTITTTAFHYQARNPAALARSFTLFRPACTVLGWTQDQKDTYRLENARLELGAAERNYAAARAALGEANRRNPVTRRYWQGKAMSNLNMRRAGLRRARAALAAILAAVPGAAA